MESPFEGQVRIEDSARVYIDPALEQAIGSLSVLTVSGRPLIRWGEVASYYNDNDVVHDIPLQVSYLRLMRIPACGHDHLENDFIGEYPALSGFDVETGIEYLFGVRPELKFGFWVASNEE